jgi:hypothetical protein
VGDRGVEEHEVAALADLERPELGGQAQHPRRVERAGQQRLAHAPAVAATASPMMTGSEETGDVPGFRSVASTQMAPASARSRAGATRSAPRNSAPGSRTAAHSAAARGATSSGCRHARWSTERAPAARATGTERLALNCSTWARSGTPSRAAIAPEPREVLVGEGDRLDVDVERVDVARRGERIDLVHPSVGVIALRDGVGEQPGDAVGAELAAQAGGARLALHREP